MAIITPYDNQVALWFHDGQSVSEQTIDQLAQTIRRYAPAVTQVFVKTTDGSDWMGVFDTKPAMAISGPDAIRTWIRTLENYGLEFHAWCVPRGLNVDAEANIILQTCQIPGVRSLILDVEPYQGFYQGPRESVRPLMLKIRSSIPSMYHIAMTVDPRPAHMNEIYPQEWFPFVNSVHLQLYWGDFQQTPEATLQSGFSTWSNYGKPIFALLQGHTVDTASMDRARTLAVNTYKSAGLSWWVLGTIDAAHFAPINHYVNGVQADVPPGADGSALNYGSPITVSVGGPGYADGAFQGVKPPLNTFSTFGTGKYHLTSDTVSNVFARWDPQIKQSGWYRIEAYIPSQHATTGRARYKLHGVKGQTSAPGEVIFSVPQMLYNDAWAALGNYEIDTSAHEPGVIYLDDWTFEPGLEISFNALRWTPILGKATASVISNITANAKAIFQHGKTLGNRVNVFSRLGDSITASPDFLTPFGQGQYNLAGYAAQLGPVLQFFSQVNVRGAGNSFANPPLAAGNGWGADRILQVGYAYTDVCTSDSQIVCEYKHSRPAIALIMIGTNDSGGVAPDVYTNNLRQIVQISINMGVIPVLSTIPPKHLTPADSARVDQWNAIIRDMTVQYSIPLWDYNFALQSVPNQGIGPDGIHPSEPPSGGAANFSAANLNYGYTVRNLTALQVLDALWKQVLS